MHDLADPVLSDLISLHSVIPVEVMQTDHEGQKNLQYRRTVEMSYNNFSILLRDGTVSPAGGMLVKTLTKCRAKTNSPSQNSYT